MICFIWVTSVGVNSSLLLFSDISPVDGLPCTNGAIMSHELTITIVCGMFLLMIINTIIYIAIGWKIAFRKGLLNLNTSKIKRTRVMILVYAGFIVFWLPLFITLMIVLVDRNREEYIFCPAEYMILTGFINSGINWGIYGLADKKFRNAFKMLLCHSRRNIMRTSVPNTAIS